MIVQKYGGSSVSTISKITKIAKNIKNTIKDKLIVVVSAMGKTTNKLSLWAEKISKDINKRELDALLSTGEQQTASLMAMALLGFGIKAISLNAFQAGIKTTNNHTKALIKSIDTKRILNLFKTYDVIVITGFQGFYKKNITTLGRGGSDTTAVALASALNAKCEIYTDVEAVYTTNPKDFQSAKKLQTLSFETALEMASAGAKVIDERALEIAKKYNTQIFLGKTCENDKTKGSYVMNKDFLEKPKVFGLSVRENIILCEIHTKNISQILSKLKNLNLNLEMFCVFDDKISFICKKNELKTLEKALKTVKNLKLIKFYDNLSKYTLVGTGFSTHPDITEKLVSSLEKKQIKLQNLVLTETTISFLNTKERSREVIFLLTSQFDLWLILQSLEQQALLAQHF